jgi:hypothetical protein
VTTALKLAPAAVLLSLLVLSGCATAAPEAPPTPEETTAADGGACTAEEVTLRVEFGDLGAEPVDACAPAGVAADALASAGITTEGTADYGDQVVCRVDGQPSVEDESCATLPADAYWALWIKTASDAEWEYAQEGVATQPVEAGQSLGLVYTVGTDSTPPQD